MTLVTSGGLSSGTPKHMSISYGTLFGKKASLQVKLKMTSEEIILAYLWFGGLATKSCPTLVTPWTVACQAPLSMGFSRQEYWSVLPFPSPGDLPDSGIKPRSPKLRADSLPTEPLGKPIVSESNYQKEALWRRKWQHTPVFLPGKSHGQRSLVGYSPWGCKESDMTERLTELIHFAVQHKITTL